MPRSGAVVQSQISGVWRTNRNTTGQYPPRLGPARRSWDVSSMPRVHFSQEGSFTSLAHAQANVLLELSVRTIMLELKLHVQVDHFTAKSDVVRRIACVSKASLKPSCCV